MRLTAEATCLSWIPRTAVEGAFKLPFGLGVAHYDNPPPDASPDVQALLRSDAIRFANQLQAWIDVEDGHIRGHGTTGGGRLGSTTVRLRQAGLTFAAVGLPDLVETPDVLVDRVRFRQTCGGHTGVPVPRTVPDAPFVRVSAPLAWSTIVLTLHTDGTSESEIADASVFPRHYLYDSDGRLTQKSALIRYKDWLRRSKEQHSPWAGFREAVPMARVKAEAERSLADTILVSGRYDQYRMPSGAMLSSVSIGDEQVAVLLDGLLMVLIDDEPAVELGPGAILDPSNRPEESKQHAKIRAETPARLAVLSRDQIDDTALLDVASEQAAALHALLERRQAAEDTNE